MRGTRFDWQGEADLGITLTPDHGENTRDTTIIATLDKDLLQTGIGSPLGIRIVARLSGSSESWQTVAVPVNLVEGTVQRIFLPVVPSVAVEASP